ncbi:MAG: methyltransferase domain-containing protein, partial [Planctomycetota bacterium JB042]
MSTTNRGSHDLDPTALFDEAYYRSHCGDVPYERDEATWQTHFSTVARNLVQRFRPKSVLDVGCAKGFLVEQLRDLGVEAYGVDASTYAISQVRDDVKPFCSVHSATEPFGRRYDLITCIEVIEHMSEEDAPAVVKNLCAHADDVLFSSTPDDYEEPTHFNIQPFEYWKELFAQNGFYPVLRDEPTYVTECAVVFRKVTKKLKVVVLSRERDEWAVVRLRLLDPLRELERQERVEMTFVSTYDEAIDVEALVDADLWVVQREFADKSLSHGVLEAARLLGKPVVFEIDDLLTNLPRSNPLWAYCQKIAPDLIDCARHADFVTTSTRPLLDELGKAESTLPEKSFVRRNVVDTDIWGGEYRERRPLPGEPLVIGWFGSATHEEDLAIVKPTIQYLSRKYAGKVVFHFWGYLPPDLADIPGVRLVRGPQANVVAHAQGVRDARIDIAIAPLTDHVFNAAKSDLKWLEYSICGIPGVYSDVAPYREEIQDGIDGIVVRNDTGEWVAALEALIVDDELRLGIARRCFERVRSEFCVDVRAMEWDDLYRSFVATGPREAPPEDVDERTSRAAALLFEFQGRQQARNGQMADAVRSLEAALDLDPERLPSVLSAGVNLSSQGRIQAGVRLLETCTERVPEAADAHLCLARV